MNELKKYFPIFQKNPKIVYLDSGASAQKFQSVIDAMDDFYTQTYANIHRGLYKWSEVSSEMYDAVREKVAKFIGAKSPSEIVFTRGTTDAINLLAGSYSKLLMAGDEVIVSELEHHSNMLPWKNLENEKGVRVKFLPVLGDGNFDYAWLKQNVGERTKLVCVSGQSNVIGIKNNIPEIVKIAHQVGAKVLIDGAQLTVHSAVNVSRDDIDFYAFSGHKIYGPTGIGVLYGKLDLLKQMPPYQLGGDMVESVSFDNVVFKEPPSKFEAGTPPIAEVVGLGVAVDFLMNIGMDNVEREGAELTSYAIQRLSKIDGVHIISGKDSNSIVSFYIDGISSFDVGTLLGSRGICVRVGKHCAEPLHHRFGIDSSIRLSFGIYNDETDVDRFIEELEKVLLLLR